MSDRTDLTRWNRAGLSRFRYIDGNAVEWLEALRQRLLAEGGSPFSAWDAIQDTALPDETDGERLERLLAQYEGERRDMLWETTRAFARACHILTEYTDAYANEGYLRTATQWENLRRMVEMLDYHPAPPSSASTMLVLEAKEGESGEVKEGFQVKYTPPDGGAPAIFETLEDISVDPALNELRLAGYNVAPGTLDGNTYKDGNGNDQTTWIATGDVEGLSAGQVVVIVGSETEKNVISMQAVSEEISSFDEDTGAITIKNEDKWKDLNKADAKMLAKAESVKVPWLHGDDVVQFKKPHGLSSREVIAWQINSGWCYSTVLESDELRIRYSGNAKPTGNVYKTNVIERNTDGELLYPLEASASGFPVVSKNRNGDAKEPSHGKKLDTDGTTAYAKKVTPDKVDRVYLVNGEDNKIGAATVAAESGFMFDGGPGELSSGDWVAVETGSNNKVLIIVAVSELEDSFSLTLRKPDGGNFQGVIKRLYGPFKYEIRPVGFDRNETPLPAGYSDLDTVSLDVDALPELLIPGHRLVLEQKTDDGFEKAVTATMTEVKAVEPKAGPIIYTLSFEPALDADAGFTLANTVIRGNVVVAGHGKTQPERVLGSGIADQINQEFVFANKEVSFVADGTMDSGVRADMDVKVDGRIWQQVSTLNDSRPTDAHYVVRMTEEGYIRIVFGDGEHGRRLPNGSNNVRINWRKGAGLSGHVNPGGLVKPIKPHRLLASVRQPMPTSGSGDMEDAMSLRENAPSSLLTFERAVSIADFIHLAASRSSVAQANAFAATSLNARCDSVEVVVVPADGAVLGDSLQRELQVWLADHSMPGVEVNVSGFESVTLGLDVVVRVKRSEFDPDSVAAAVKASLLASVSLKNRRIGQAIYRAELYAIVEAVQGVENSTCLISAVNEADDVTASPLTVKGRDGATIKTIKATQRQVIYLAADGLVVNVGYEEFSL